MPEEEDGLERVGQPKTESVYFDAYVGLESVDRETEIKNQQIVEEMIDTRKMSSNVERKTVIKTEEPATTVPKDKGPRMEGTTFMQKQA